MGLPEFTVEADGNNPVVIGLLNAKHRLSKVSNTEFR